MDKNILVLSNIFKSYRQGSEYITIFDNFNLTVNKGEFISITGPSGCLLYTSPSPRDRTRSRMPSSA